MVKTGDDSGSSESGDDQYDYFINVGKNDYFSVRVKNLDTYNQKYKAEIDSFLEEYDLPVYVIPHNSRCNYPEFPIEVQLF